MAKRLSEMSPVEAEKRRQQNREAKARHRAKQLSSPLNQNQSESQQPQSPLQATEILGYGSTEAESGEFERKAPATRDEKAYTRLLDDYLGPLTFLVMLILCMIRRIPQPHAVQIAETLAVNQEEQDLIIPPLARFLDKQKLPAEVKQKVLQSGDAIGLLLGVSAYVIRVGMTLNQLGGMNYAQPGGQAQESTAQNGVPGGNGTYIGGYTGLAAAGLAQYNPET